MAKVLYLVSTLAAASYVSAQAAPSWQYVPQQCASQCSQTVQIAYLCETQYTSSTDTYGCFCNSFPSDAATCVSCLNSNNAAALAQLLTSTQTACPQAKQACFFQCSFDTCNSADIPCQCSASYLENIYNCGSCNTANGNTAATQLKDWQALQDSCKNQNYTGATQSFTTKAIASVTGTQNYQSVTLTAQGGGIAATGGSSLAAGVGPTTISGGLAAGSTAASSASVAGASGAAGASASKASGASASGSAAAATTSKSAANQNIIPAFGGLLAIVGAVATLF